MIGYVIKEGINMYISGKELDKLEYIGEGTEGVVRKKGKLALKRFYELDDYKKSCLKAQFNMPTKYFVFPNEELYIDGIYMGCVNNYIVGETLEEYSFNNFESILTLVKKVESEIKIFSDAKVQILDLLPRNTLITEEGFKIIDTTKYQIVSDVYEARVVNLKRFNSFFKNIILLKDIDEETFINFIFRNTKLMELYFSMAMVETKTRFSQFLELFLDSFKLQTNEEYKKRVLK